MAKLLPQKFFERATTTVARELIGKHLLRKVDGVWLRSRIVETEAYLGKGDPGSHSAKGPTPRSAVMFGPPGVIYVYFIYGNYFMLNFVTERDGKAGAVLIRAVEPLEGIEKMKQLRGKKHALRNLTSGPAKLAMALGITADLNKKELGSPHLAVEDAPSVSRNKIVKTTRIGITEGADLELRFYEKDNGFVSKR